MNKKHDHTLETLLDLDGYLAEIGHGYWIKIEGRRAEQDQAKPYGIKYSLTLHDSHGERVLGYDNAHSIPSKAPIKAHDHVHRSGKVISYSYTDAAKLLEDFCKDIDRIVGRIN